MKNKCPKCSATFPSDYKFCKYDGVELIKQNEFRFRCEVCNKIYPEEIKFCPDDGGQIVQTNPLQDQDYAEEGKVIEQSTELKKNYKETFWPFKGRLRRSEYFSFYFAIVIFAFFIVSSLHNDTLVRILSIISTIVVTIITVKRLHDLNISGWLAIVYLLMLLVSIYVSVELNNTTGSVIENITVVLFGAGIIAGLCLIFIEGTKGPNKYGPESDSLFRDKP